MNSREKNRKIAKMVRELRELHSAGDDVLSTLADELSAESDAMILQEDASELLAAEFLAALAFAVADYVQMNTGNKSGSIQKA